VPSGEVMLTVGRVAIFADGLDELWCVKLRSMLDGSIRRSVR
jgi:hypothetical protein